jgi:hypothetical protein
MSSIIPSQQFPDITAYQIYSDLEKASQRDLNQQDAVRYLDNEQKHNLIENNQIASDASTINLQQIVVHQRDTAHQLVDIVRYPDKVHQLVDTVRYLDNEQEHKTLPKDDMYFCPFCCAEYNCEEDIRKHIFIHSVRKQYKCYICKNDIEKNRNVIIKHMHENHKDDATIIGFTDTFMNIFKKNTEDKEKYYKCKDRLDCTGCIIFGLTVIVSVVLLAVYLR